MRTSKSFAVKQPKNNTIQKALFKNTLLQIKQSGLDYSINDGHNYGETFESRVKGSIAQVFQNGFRNIILVGDDTPQLCTQQLRFAHQKITNETFVVGPSKDGGTYLIAFNQKQFEQGILENLSWQTDCFFQSLYRKIETTQLKKEILPLLDDLDSISAINNFINHYAFLKFSQLIKQIHEDHKPQIFFSYSIQEKPFSIIKDRAPPIAA
jgi:glycosyltransferase A (GT-A) superfamily protein (DUF2064 family)